MAKCPHCESNLLRINLTGVEASAFMGTSWNTVIYSCPHCHAALSVGIDPVALKHDTVQEILKGLGKR